MKDRDVYICKSEPVGTEHIQNVHIHIQNCIPSELEKGQSWRDAMSDFYTKEADWIESALWKSLPGGTYDRLAAAILKRTASLYHLSHGDIEERDR